MGVSDLFGSIDKAGSEEEAPSARNEMAGPAAAATGARNESSVLFSLSALTSAAASTPTKSAPKPAAPTASKPSRDDIDSGLIDLKALTASAAEAQSAGPVAPPPLGMAPPLGLGVAPPLGMSSPVSGGFEAIAADMPQQKNRTGLYIGGAIVLAALIFVGFNLAQPSDPAQAPAAAVPAPTPTNEPEAEATANSESGTLAKPPATGTAGEEEAKPDAGDKKIATKRSYRRRSAGSGAAKPAGGGDTTAAAPAAAPAPKKSSSPCGCAPSDLQCAMRCAAK
jgi:hypothetical protein